MTQHTLVPDWVHWIAQDEDGSWWGFEVEPLQYHAGWYENELGRSIKLEKREYNPDWQASLQRFTGYSPARKN